MAAIYNYFWPPPKELVPMSPNDIAHDTALRAHMQEALYMHEKKFCPSEVAASLTVAELANLGFRNWQGIMTGVLVLIEEMRAFGDLEVFIREDASGRGAGSKGGKGKFTKKWSDDVDLELSEWKGPLRIRRVGPI